MYQGYQLLFSSRSQGKWVQGAIVSSRPPKWLGTGGADVPVVTFLREVGQQSAGDRERG